MSERIPGGVVHQMPADLRTALLANDTALTAEYVWGRQVGEDTINP